jgi:hypothetical protein
MHGFRVHCFRVTKNITLSAEEKLIESARVRARLEKTTLNSVFREWLARYSTQNVAHGRYDSLMGELKRVSTGRRFSREDLNER